METPNPIPTGGSATPSLRDRVEEVLERIRPYVMMDGGNVEVANIDEKEGVVYLRMQGSCHGCPSSLMTLKMGIENRLRRTVPEVVAVEAV